MAMAVDSTTVLPFQNNLVEGSLAWAEQMITKWDPDTSRSPHANVTAIFLQSRDEARRFLFAVHDLQRAMNCMADSDSHSELVRVGRFMETAMSRLQKEFAEMLSDNGDASPVSPSQSPGTSSTFRSYLTDHESDGEDSLPTAKLDYLRAVAECMMSSGYARECVEIYKGSRRSVVEDGLSRLVVEKVSPSNVQKLNWESLEFKVNQWLAATGVIFADIFAREKALCDFVFASSERMRDSCFAEIARDAAVEFFRFPHLVASKNKTPFEKVLHYLNMYRSLRDLSPEIESLFSSKSTGMVQSQVDASLLKLGVTIRSMLANFESTIQKDASKSTPSGGGLHVLTQSVMDHLVPLADYADILGEILEGGQSWAPMAIAPEPSMDTEKGSSSAAARLSWLLTVLFSKMDVKAELYKDGSQSYLFLANNIQYVVNRARESKLAQLLGHEWLLSHERKARSFARSFLKLSWNRVLEAIPMDLSLLPDVEARRRCMVQFNMAFEEACKRQVGLVVLDEGVRKEIKSAVARNIVGMYRVFYETCRAELKTEEDPKVVVRFAPEDLLNRLSGLYSERVDASDWEWSSSGSKGIGSGGSTGKGSLWRWWRGLKMKSSSFTLSFCSLISYIQYNSSYIFRV